MKACSAARRSAGESTSSGSATSSHGTLRVRAAVEKRPRAGVAPEAGDRGEQGPLDQHRMPGIAPVGGADGVPLRSSCGEDPRDGRGADEWLIAEQYDHGGTVGERHDPGPEGRRHPLRPVRADERLSALQVDLRRDPAGTGAEYHNDRIEPRRRGVNECMLEQRPARERRELLRLGTEPAPRTCSEDEAADRSRVRAPRHRSAHAASILQPTRAHRGFHTGGGTDAIDRGESVRATFRGPREAEG